MTAIKPGTRVWAIQNADETAVYAFGFGTYMGDFPYPGIPGGDFLQELTKGIPNPKIILDDNAGVVWGCECWWVEAGHPAVTEKFARGRTVARIPAPHPPENAETKPPLSQEDLAQGVIPDLTEAEADAFAAALDDAPEKKNE